MIDDVMSLFFSSFFTLSVLSNMLYGRLNAFDSQVEFNISEWEKKIVVSLDQYVEFCFDILPLCTRSLSSYFLFCLDHV